MTVTYGADYSARELSPSELDHFTQYDIRFLIRYIGWPGNPKCISHYPGAYKAHVQAGRLVLLSAEGDTDDPAGGFAGGAAMARRALADANSIGYPASLPIFFWNNGSISPGGVDWGLSRCDRRPERLAQPSGSAPVTRQQEPAKWLTSPPTRWPTPSWASSTTP